MSNRTASNGAAVVSDSFNHNVQYIAHSELIRTLSRSSREGWEAVSVCPYTVEKDGEVLSGYCVVTKRPMNGGLSVNEVLAMRSSVADALAQAQAALDSLSTADITTVPTTRASLETLVAQLLRISGDL